MNIHKYFSIKKMSKPLFELTQKTKASKPRKPRIAANGILSIVISCVGLFGMSIAQAQTCPANSYPATFSWSSSPGTGNEWLTSNQNTGDSQTYTVNYTGAGGITGTVDVTVTLQDPNGVNGDNNFVCPLAACDGVTTQTNDFGFGGGYLSIGQTTLNSVTETVGFDFGFSESVYMESFTIGDIDSVGYNSGGFEPDSSFQDVVSFIASNGGSNVPLTLTGGSNMTVTGQTAQANTAAGVNGDLTHTDPAGMLTVSANAILDTFSLTYNNGPVDAANEPGSNGVSNGHAIAVSGFDFCVQGAPPELSITKTSSANGGPVSPGNTITYTIEVENTGSSTVTDVVLSDVLPAGVSYSGGAQKTYPVGGSGIFTHDMGAATFDVSGLTQSYTVTSSDIPAGATLDTYGFTTTGTSSDWLSDISLSTTYPGGTAYTLAAGIFSNIPGPGNWNVSQGPGSFSGSAEGLYQFNWGDIVDGLFGVDDNSISTAQFTINYSSPRAPTTDAAGAPPNLVTAADNIDLLPGETMTVTFDVLVDDPLNSSINQLANTASATSAEITTPVTDTVIDGVARMTVTKTQVSGENPVTQPGTLGYEIVIQNTGGVTLTNVVPTDTLPDGSTGTLTGPVETGGTGTNGDGLLDVGETWTYTISYTVTQSDVDAELTLVNRVSVTTTEIPVPVEDTAVTEISENPDMLVTKTQTGGENPVTQPGVLDYTITVENTGNQTLTNVVPTDTLPDGSTGTLTGPTGDTDSDGELDITETWTYTISYTVTQADIDAGVTLINEVSVLVFQDILREDTAETEITQNPAMEVTKTQTGGENPVTQPGVLDYTITVENTGNQTLTNVVPTDTLPDGSTGTLTGPVETGGTGTNGDGLLDVGETWTYTISYTVTQSDVDAELTLVNRVSVTTTEIPVPVEDTAVTEISENPDMLVTKTQTGGENPVTQPGVLDYTITVENTGNQTLTNVVPTDTLPDGSTGTLTGPTGDTDSDGELDITETWTYTISYTVTQADIDAGVTLINEVSVLVFQDILREDTAETEITQNPAMEVTKTQTGGENPVTQPGVLDYTITVENTGNQTLTNVVPTDTLPDGSTGTLTGPVETGGTGTNGDGLLDVGETWTYTISYTVTQSDVDAGANLVNTVSVVTDEIPTPEEDDASTPVTLNPAMEVTKTQTGGENPVTQPGVLDYTITVENTGNQTLTNVVPTDTLPDGSTGTLTGPVETGGTGTNGDGLLDVGETWTYTISYTVTQSDVDAELTLVNRVSVTTTEIPVPVEDTAVTEISENPDMLVTKTQTGGENPVTQPGVLDYTITVENTGNQTLTNVVPTDTLPDGSTGTLTGPTGDTDSDGELDITETWTYTISYTVTQADIDAGVTLINEVSVLVFQDILREDTAETEITQNPAMEVTKTQTGGENPVTQPGVLDYTITVENTGNQTLTNVVPTDTLPDGSTGTLTGPVETGGTGTNGDGLLDVGETWTYTISYTVTQSDVDAELTLVNRVSVTTTEIPVPVEDTAVTEISENPDMLVTKTQTGGENPVTQPGVLDYTITVENTGNQTLTNVVPTDTLPDGSTGTLTGPTGDTDSDGELDITETWTYTISYTVTQADIDAGVTLINEVSVLVFQDILREDTAETEITQNPAMEVTKTQTGGENPVTQPGVLDYTITVENTGNQTLTNVVPTDTLPDGSTGTLTGPVETGGTGTNGDGLLDVGETWTYTISYTVTQSDVDAELTLVNRVSVTTTEIPVPVEDTAVTEISENPDMLVTKTQTGGENPVTQPGVLDYTITVENTGNQTLTNVVPTDTLPDGSTGTLTGPTGDTDSDGELDITETWTYTISYTVTQADIDAGVTLINEVSVLVFQDILREDTAETEITQNPAMEVTKTQTGGENPVTQPGVLDYTITVENTGNQTLTNVVPTDTLPDGSTGTLTGPVETGGTGTNGDGLLDVGETWTYTISYTVTQSDVDAGANLVNTVSVVTDEIPTPEEDDASTPVTLNPAMEVTKTQTGGENPVTQPGVLDYTITVENTGNQTLTNVVPTDTLPDGSTGTLTGPVETGGTGTNGDGLLDVGETWTYTISYTVTQSDVDAELTLVNRVSVTTTEIPVPVEDTAVTEISENPDMLVTKTQTGGENPVTQPGVLDYTITVENTGNQTLTNVVPTDTLPDGSTGTLTGPTGDTDSDGELDITETWTYTISYTVTQADIDAGVTLINEVSVLVFQDILREDTAETEITQNPAMEVTKTQTGGENPVTQPGVLDYTITVENTGNQTLTNVVPTDTLPDGSTGTLTGPVETGGTGTNGDGLLDVGETWTYTISYTVTQSDVDAGANLVNTVSVVTDEIPTPEEDDASTPVTLNPAMEVTKTQTGGENPVTQPGVLDYTITVENTGNQTLTNVVPTDTLPDGSTGTLTGPVETGGTGTNGDGLLDVGETWTYTISYTVTQSDVDAELTLVNRVSVTTTEIPVPVEDTAVTEISENPDMLVTKTQTGGENPVTQPGVLDYTITVENTGNQTLTNVVPTDTLPDGSTGTLTGPVETGGTGTNGDGLLDVGETWTYTISYTVTQSDVDAGANLVNTVSVVTDEIPTPEEDDASTPVTLNPAMEVTKTQTGGENPVTQPGVLDYTITVENTGNQTLTNVVPTDTLPDGSTGTLTGPVETGGTGTNGDGLLDVGETWTYTISYTVTQSDVDAELTLVNRVSVTTTEIPVPVEDTAVTEISENPDMLVTKTQTGGENPVTQPGVLDYTITVENTGNQTLTNVVPTDTLPDGSTGTLTGPVETGGTGTNGDGLLDVGETWTYTISYTVTQSDVDAGANLVNTVSVVTDEIPTPEEDDASTPVTLNPAMEVTKTQTGGENPVTQPGVLDYTITVENTGNQTLTNVVPTDTLPDGSTGTLTGPVETGGTGTNGDGLLDVGETWTYTISYTVTQSDVDAELTLVNRVSVTTTEIPVPVEDTAVTEISENPDMLVTKTQTGGENPVTQPGVLDYTITVENTGVPTDTPDGSTGTLTGPVETGGTGTTLARRGRIRSLIR